VKTAGFWTKDWLLGLAVAIVLFLFAGSDLIQSLGRKAYDMGVRATDRTPSDRISVIAIDDASIQNIGRFQTGDEFAQALRACVGTRKLQVGITI
jgi:serine/threonine-protein kinase